MDQKRWELRRSGRRGGWRRSFGGQSVEALAEQICGLSELLKGEAATLKDSEQEVLEERSVGLSLSCLGTLGTGGVVRQAGDRDRLGP